MNLAVALMYGHTLNSLGFLARGLLQPLAPCCAAATANGGACLLLDRAAGAGAEDPSGSPSGDAVATASARRDRAATRGSASQRARTTPG